MDTGNTGGKGQDHAEGGRHSGGNRASAGLAEPAAGDAGVGGGGSLRRAGRDPERRRFRQIGSTKRGDRYADCRIRTGFAFNRHICYVNGYRKRSSGESRPKPLI